LVLSLSRKACAEVRRDSAWRLLELAERLVDILLVQVLRAALDQDRNKDFGWIGALTDPRIGKAIQMMHGDVAHPWSLMQLCASVAMSRSAFSKRFKALVGHAPLDYLLRWRMRVARNMLRQGVPVATVASDVGYASESAFRHAFKRLYGHAPGRYWRETEKPSWPEDPSANRHT
jgi:transcriptional regulator GlxA family with amidase domain